VGKKKKKDRGDAANLSAERIAEILLNSSIPDALHTIEFGGRLTKKVESIADKKGVRRGIRVVTGHQSFVLWVQVRKRKQPVYCDACDEMPEHVTDEHAPGCDDHGKLMCALHHACDPDEYFDDDEGAVCPHCEQRSTDPNHAANCLANPETD